MNIKIRKVMILSAILMLVFSFSLIVPSSIASFTTDDYSIDISKEYTSGYINTSDPNFMLWYSWVGTNVSQVIYAALTSEVLPPPFTTVYVQHLVLSNHSEAFIGISLMLIEFYNDTNKNQIPDFNPTTGESEVKYIMVLNASEKATVYPISKKIINESVVNYQWGIRHNKLQTVIANPDGTLIDFNGGILNALLDHFTLNFSLSVDYSKNRTILKQIFDIGNITLYAYNFPDFTKKDLDPSSFYNLSMSLLFGVTVETLDNATVISGDQPINATNPDLPSTEINKSSILIGNRRALDFYFDENYTIKETGQNYSVKTVAYSKEAVPPFIQDVDLALGPLYSPVEEALDKIKITNMIPEISIIKSSFIYRICYPYWNGSAIYHDPTIIAFANGTLQYLPPPPPPDSIPVFTLPYLVTILIAFILSFYAIGRTFKLSKDKKYMKGGLHE